MTALYRWIALTATIIAGMSVYQLTPTKITATAAATVPNTVFAPPPPQPCPASITWITAPNPPLEIGNGVPVNQETNCQFYQFAWQWFLSLAQPSSSAQGQRVFETLNVFQPNALNQCNNPKITGQAAAVKALFARIEKPKTATIDPVTPGELLQATGEPLYDQQGNIVFYNIYYNETECQATSSGFLPNTIEIKASWRILPGADPSYYTMSGTLNGQPVTFGMVGFHLVINTKDHPEFVWATLEHFGNDPDCTNPPPPPSAGWSFLSAACSKCSNSCSPGKCNLTQCPNQGCTMNAGELLKPPPLKCTAPECDINEVCRVYRNGTDPGPMTGGNNNDTNRFNIDTLNAQLQVFLRKLPSNSPMAVWKSYRMIGGLWTNGGVASTGQDVQRGSLELANTTMETFFQQPNRNCFTCHTYTPPPPSTNNPLLVSHIVCSLLPNSTTNCPSNLQMKLHAKDNQ